MTGGNDESLFLGLDASTQALKASLVDSLLVVVDEVEVRFDSDLPHYHTRGGTLPSEAADGQVHSPVALLVEAFDVLFDRIKQASWPVHRIVSISAAGQQHASVYWSRSASQALASANDPSKKLSEQITATAFSRQTVPSWQDSSTLAECEALEAQFPGGAQGLIHNTGSKAHARFTGPQIMRFRRLNPQAYEETSRISLVSSFVTTLLCLDGEVKPVDESDACGMNMWDIPSQQWSKDALSIISAGQPAELESKMGSVELDAARVVGKISRWLQLRYGFDKSCIVCSATGDNPATFLSFTLNQAEALVSLGTSDTLLVSTNQYCPHGEYHAFAHPAQSPGRERRYFNMLVYKNGSLAREYVRDRHYQSSWDEFNQSIIAQCSRKGDVTRTGFWWLKPEIIPANARGTYKFESTASSPISQSLVDEFTNESGNALAMLESQFFSFRVRSSSILSSSDASGQEESEGGARLKRVYASGGASKNLTLLSVLANIMGCEIVKPSTSGSGREANACSVGAAYKAAWAHARNRDGGDVAFDDFVNALRSKRSDGEHHFVVVAIPDRVTTKRLGYDEERFKQWRSFEAEALALSASSGC